MGRSYTPRYVCEIVVPGTYHTPMSWDVKSRYGARGYGKPTDANLKKYVEGFEASTKPGGVNAHLGETIVTSARIIDQFEGGVVATYKQPEPIVWE